MTVIAPLLWTLPWVVPPIIGLWRARRSRSLDEFSAVAPDDAPFVSVIIPARDERRNIERCVRSVLASTYPYFEVIVVDDHSTDGTGELARAIATDDPRVRVIDAPRLPGDWFGKQWACSTGAHVATGSLLLFTDADTAHAPDLLPRSVNALRVRTAEMFSVAGHQELHSFWERVVQPMVFGLLSLRYGGMEDVSATRNPSHAIANGQFILVQRDAYEAMGGHERVKHTVAEDLMLAQEWVRAGRRLVLMLGLKQLSTHMYASLSEIIAGWRKNIYAGGRMASIGGRVGRALYPAFLIGTPLLGLVPVVALLLAGFGILSAPWLIWSATIVVVGLLFWGAIYHFMSEARAYALLYPIGLAVLLYIATSSVWRGEQVQWKQREYRAG